MVREIVDESQPKAIEAKRKYGYIARVALQPSHSPVSTLPIVVRALDHRHKLKYAISPSTKQHRCWIETYNFL